MWSRDPFRRSSPRGVPFATGNPGTAGQTLPTTRTSPPARARSSSPTRSGASSASGASTNRRSRHRGWGRVRSGSSSDDAVDPDDVGVEGARAPPHRPHPAGRRLQAVALLEDPVGVDVERHRQLDHQVEERPLVLGAAHRLGLVDLGHGGDRRGAAGPELVDGPAEVGRAGRRGWTRARGTPAGWAASADGRVTGCGPPARPPCRCRRPAAAGACGGPPSPR